MLKNFPMWSNFFKDQDLAKKKQIDILKDTYLCNNLDKKELKKLLDILHERDYSIGEPLFLENNPGAGLYIIEEGSIKVEKETAGKNKIQLALLSKGSFLGELSLLNDSLRSASAYCLTPTKALILFKSDFFEFIKYHPKIGNKLLFNLSKIIGKRLIETNKKLLDCNTMRNKNER